jgi:UPF0755 protein
VLSVALVLIVGLAAVFLGPPIYHHFNPADYSGNGSGSVAIEVHPNDSAQDIGDELHSKGVVASASAFVDAAKSDKRSSSIQPGSYTMTKHISGKKALQELLNPDNKAPGVLIAEGQTTLDVEETLTRARCTAASPQTARCGLGLPRADITAALKNVDQLGLPTEYGKPTSAEGFLYPRTYTLDSNSTATDALTEMVGRFVDEVRAIGFTADAKALKLTPYQALIIASIAQREAKFPEDMAKVARVILNRIAQNIPLKIDATTIYGAELNGVADTSKIDYATYDTPYNTYLHPGLTPTPISNPGADAMTGAVHPAAGNWLYYVNGDAEGHLYFTNSETAFQNAVARCQQNNWGC